MNDNGDDDGWTDDKGYSLRAPSGLRRRKTKRKAAAKGATRKRRVVRKAAKKKVGRKQAKRKAHKK
jgi:hypothetical protein